jgi:hypothetical protein
MVPLWKLSWASQTLLFPAAVAQPNWGEWAFQVLLKGL